VKKAVLFAFNGEPVCFIHVLLNALDMNGKGCEVRVVIEGAATGLVPEMIREGSPLFGLFQKARAQGLIDGACRACSAKMGATRAVEEAGLAFLDDMSGHPSMSGYIDRGYEIITF